MVYRWSHKVGWEPKIFAANIIETVCCNKNNASENECIKKKHIQIINGKILEQVEWQGILLVPL